MEYINSVRNKKGELRPWEEYNKIAINEQKLDQSICSVQTGYFVYKDYLIERDFQNEIRK